VQDIIANCATYSDDFKCETCINQFLLTVGKIACASQIPFAKSKLTMKNIKCVRVHIITEGFMACVAFIQGCLVYLDKDTCQTC